MANIRIAYETLEALSRAVFAALGFRADEAATITDVLLTADLYGIESHGVQRMMRYYNSLANDNIKRDAVPRVVKETPVSVVLDGGAGMGQLVAADATRHAIAKAKAVGIGMAAVRNSNHFGIAGYYSKMACDEGLLGVAMTNTESLMVHTNAAAPLLGSNPIAVSMPADPVPFWFDAATVVVPRGKIEVYNKRGDALHDGWAVDERGVVTDDAGRVLSNILSHRGGGILPLGGADELTGGHKGYGYAMICELFTAILSGGATSNHHTRAHGKGAGSCHFFLALDPALFGDPDDIRARLSTLLQELRDAPLAAGKTRIYTHGEKEIEAAERSRRDGIAVNPKTLSELETILAALGLDRGAYLPGVPRP